VAVSQWRREIDADDRLRTLTPNSWTSYVMILGLAGLGVLITKLLARRVIRDMDLAGALRYMWAIYWLLPIEILFVVGLFDYSGVTDVWVKHAWTIDAMAWFREQYCYPGTAYTKCVVPIGGGESYDSEDDWCEAMYNATDCREIRDEAQDDFLKTSYGFITANGIWGVFLIVLLFLALTLLEGIITAPIVRSSKQANIPFWLTLPIIGCIVGGSLLLFSPTTVTGDDSSDQVYWIGVAFFACAGTFTIAALLGWFMSAFSVLSDKSKRRKHIALLCFINVLVLTLLTVVAIFAASVIYLSSIVDIEMDDNMRGNIACDLATASSCTGCDESEQRCPEWTAEDLQTMLQSQVKQSAILSAILAIYAVTAIRFGFDLRKHLSRYQIEYV